MRVRVSNNSAYARMFALPVRAYSLRPESSVVKLADGDDNDATNTGATAGVDRCEMTLTVRNREALRILVLMDDCAFQSTRHRRTRHQEGEP